MKDKGITLIALVITLIVLLILAGVSIATLTGDNGILNQAQRAKEETEIATDEEQRKLAMTEAATNLENTTYVDKSGKEVPIPAGFAPTRIEGENTVDDGLVIIDSEGNEFVWIPVEADQDKTNYENANNLSTSEGWPTYAYNVSADGSTENPALQAKTGWANNPDPDDDRAMENIKISVGKYEGFYVARYEAGVPSNASFYVPSNANSNGATYTEKNEEEAENMLAEKRNVTEENEVKLKPVSKKENQVWNFISQENAVKLSKNMYKDNSSVNSYLIDSNAWNYICKYIFQEKKSINLEDSLKHGNYYKNATTNYEGIRGLFALHTFSANTNTWTFATEYEYGNIPIGYAPKNADSNHNRLELATGICDDFKLYNIYDMAGNMYEWTAEKVSWPSSGDEKKDYAVTRDGGLGPINAKIPIALSGGARCVSEYEVDLGFRCVLYLK